MIGAMAGGAVARNGLALLVLVVGLSACSERELILPGEREAIRPEVTPLTIEGEADGIAPLSLPAATRNADWTQTGGSPLHVIDHPELGANLSRVWSADIGAGSGKRTRLTSQPVIAGGSIYTLDAAATVSALDLNGRVLWRADLTPPDEQPGQGFGGGLAYDNGGLFATTGFGEVISLDPASGDVLWRTGIDAAIRAAPGASDGTVVAVGRNDVAFGLDAATGDLNWRVQGTGRGAGLLGGSSPAIRGPLTIIPFSSGEVTGVLTRNGRSVWNAAITGGRRGLVRSRIGDISSDPVVANDIVFAANQAGRLISMDRRSGERLWTLQEGAYGPVVPAGGSVFLVSDIGAVLRVDAETGAEIWRADLPEWRNPRKREEAIPHFGPTLAGGRLFVASGDGIMRVYDPTSGTELGTIDIPGGAASAPAIAGGRLYLLSQSGQLHAFQ